MILYTQKSMRYWEMIFIAETFYCEFFICLNFIIINCYHYIKKETPSNGSPLRKSPSFSLLTRLQNADLDYPIPDEISPEIVHSYTGQSLYAKKLVQPYLFLPVKPSTLLESG